MVLVLHSMVYQGSGLRLVGRRSHWCLASSTGVQMWFGKRREGSQPGFKPASNSDGSCTTFHFGDFADLHIRVEALRTRCSLNSLSKRNILS